MLYGSYDVYCKRCERTDRVWGGTGNHDCEKCGEKKTVSDGAALLKCPNQSCGNIDLVGGVTRQHECSKCGSQMRR